MQKPYTPLQLSLKAFLEVVRAHPGWGVLYPILVNVTAILQLGQIFIFGRLIDNIVDLLKSDFVFSVGAFMHTAAFDNFIIIILIYLLLAFSSKLSDYLSLNITDEFSAHFRLKMMQQLSRLNLQDFEQRDLQNYLANAPVYSQPTVLDTYFKMTNLVYNTVSLILAAAIVIKAMAWWGILVGLFVIPEAFYRYHHSVRMKQFRDREADRFKYNEYLFKQSTLPLNFPELRIDNIFPFFIGSMRDSVNKYYKPLYRIRLMRETGAAFLQWFDRLFLRFAQILLIPISISARYTIGTFKYLFDYLEQVYDSSWEVLWGILIIRINSLYVADYFNFMEYQGFGDITSGTAILDPLKVPRIEFANISFSYPGRETAALERVNFTIEPGEKVAIIGPDNCGKSTIAKLLCGLYRVEPGDILIDGISIKNLARGELKNKIAVVFENFVMYNFSIRKNIVVTQNERDFNRRLYEEALEATGLDVWLREEHMDDHTALGKLFGNGIDISTGHWQRIAIARSLYYDLPVLVLDESLTQIDSFSRRPILERIIKLRPKQTLINITQEVADKDLFDRLIYLEKGRVTKVEQGR